MECEKDAVRHAAPFGNFCEGYQQVSSCNLGNGFTEEKIAAFTQPMRANVLDGDMPLRRAYVRSVIDQVEVDDEEIRIIGRRTVLEWLVMGSGAAPAGVPSFVRKWRTRHDSNVWPLPSEGSALSS
jgi:site-specific DNA recombinase